MARCDSTWWSAEIPAGWTAEDGEACATLIGAKGALQISAARKESGDVTDEDLVEYAHDTFGAAASFSPVTVGSLRGLHRQWREGEAPRQAWFLRQGPLLLLVTYYADSEDCSADASGIDQVLASLSLAEGAA